MQRGTSWPILAALLLATGCAGPDESTGPTDPARLPSLIAARACAIGLPPAASIIYQDAEPDVHPGTNLETLLTTKVMMLIVRDRIRRAEARPAAERAVECLELLQK